MIRTEQATEFRRDVGYAFRMLRRSPGFTAVVLITLALGIGANSAIFSVVHGVVFAQLPFRDPDRLHVVRTLYPDGTPYSLSAPDFMSVRQDSRTLEQVEAYSTGVYTMLGAGEPREVRGATVSDGLIGLLGLRVATGRAFAAGENEPGRASVALLDHGFWQRQFGGDPGVLGRSLTIGGRPLTIVGVLAPGASIPSETEIYAPLEYTNTFSASTAQGRRGEFLRVVARTKPGIGAQQLEDDLRRLGTQLQQQFQQTNSGLTFTGTSLEQFILGDVRTPLLVLFGAVGFVLLVACANVANLLLARASVREAELAVRAALGAGRIRLLRQLLTEAIVLGLAGAIVGLAIAYAATRALVAAQPADIPRLDEIGLNGTVVAFTFGIALLTSIACGVLPALHATSNRLSTGLRSAGRSGDGGGGHRIRASLIVAEMAFAVVLLTGAGLLIRSFVNLTRVDPGFRTEQGMSLRVTLQGEKYRDNAVVRLRVAEFEERLRALPGVAAVGTTSVLPLSGNGAMNGFAVDGAPPPPPDVNAEIAVASVTPDYFRALGSSIRRGRGFTSRDNETAPLVAVMNEAGVRRWFGGQDAVGKRVSVNGVSREIVGVVEDVLQQQPGQAAAPQLFMTFAQRTTRSLRIVVRAGGDPAPLVAAIRTEIRNIDPDLAVAAFSPLDQLVARSIARPRLYTALLSLFAGVALALAAIGIFGVMSYAVAQRAREISIRMALGARLGHVLRIVVGRAMALAGLGLALGLGAAVALGRVLQDQLFGVTLFDPLTLGAVVVVLGTSAAIASVLPARRAATVDPATAMREP